MYLFWIVSSLAHMTEINSQISLSFPEKMFHWSWVHYIDTSLHFKKLKMRENYNDEKYGKLIWSNFWKLAYKIVRWGTETWRSNVQMVWASCKKESIRFCKLEMTWSLSCSLLEHIIFCKGCTTLSSYAIAVIFQCPIIESWFRLRKKVLSHYMTGFLELQNIFGLWSVVNYARRRKVFENKLFVIWKPKEQINETKNGRGIQHETSLDKSLYSYEYVSSSESFTITRSNSDASRGTDILGMAFHVRLPWSSLGR